MKTKSKGTRGENEVRKLLEADGYEMYRSTGSIGTFDLIGIRLHADGPHEVVLAQVKRFGDRRGYGRMPLLKQLCTWCGLAYLMPRLYERPDRGCWKVTDAWPESADPFPDSELSLPDSL